MSEGVLAQLKVLIGANISKLKSGLDEAALHQEKYARKTEHSFHRIGQVIERLVGPLSETGRKIALGFDALGASAAEAGKGLSGIAGGLGLIGGIGAAGAAAAGVGLFALANKAAEAGAAIYDASEKTGIAASEMSGLKALTMETGEDFDGLTKALSRFGVNLTNALIDPSTIGARELQSLLGGAKGLNELGLKPLGERLQIVTKRIFSLSDVAQQHAMMQALLGRGWMDNVDTLKLLATQGYGPAIAQARKFGVFFDEGAARRSKQFTEEWKTLKSELAGLAVATGEELIPAFNKLMVLLVGMGSTVSNLGHEFAAVGLAAGGFFSKAAEQWKKANLDPTQEMTDFLVHVQSLTAGAEHGNNKIGDISGHHGPKLKLDPNIATWARALNEALQARNKAEGEYNSILLDLAGHVDTTDAATVKFHDTMAKLNAIELQGVDVTKARADAEKQFATAIEATQASIQSSWKMPSWTGAFKSAMPGGKPLTLSQLAALPETSPDTSLSAMKALQKETELSAASFNQLAKAFPNLSEAEVAALPAGQKMIDQLAHLEKHGEQAITTLHNLRDALIAEGNDLSGNLVANLSEGIHSAEDELTKLATGQRFNFVGVLQKMGEGTVHSFIQKGVGSLLGKFGLGDGSKPDGTANNPLYVTPVDASGNIFKNTGFGGKLSGIVDTFPGSKSGGMFDSLKSTLSGFFKGTGGGLLGAIGKIGSIFGGFLAGGGPVTPGKAYVVGEKHAEWFVPGVRGSVMPALQAGSSAKPMVYAPTFNVTTPDVDSFRRSHGQLLSEGYDQMRRMHQRNG